MSSKCNRQSSIHRSLHDCKRRYPKLVGSCIIIISRPWLWVWNDDRESSIGLLIHFRAGDRRAHGVSANVLLCFVFCTVKATRMPWFFLAFCGSIQVSKGNGVPLLFFLFFFFFWNTRGAWPPAHAKYDVKCHMVFYVIMVTSWMTLLMTKSTNIVMEDAWVRPLAKPYLHLSATCDVMLSWKIEVWMANHLACDSNCNAVTLWLPQKW